MTFTDYTWVEIWNDWLAHGQFVQWQDSLHLDQAGAHTDQAHGLSFDSSSVIRLALSYPV